MKLLIISHTPHYLSCDGSIVAWGSTVRELDDLASLFDEVVHLAPLHPGHPPRSSLPYSSKRIRFVSVKPAGGENLSSKLSILGKIPSWLGAMRIAITEADAIHIRCPAGISLVALLAQRLWGRNKPTWLKYAGNWKPDKTEPWSYKIQRYLLARNFHHGVVTVNGRWDNQPDHIVTFNNPSFSMSEWYQAMQDAKEKDLFLPLNLLFVGRVDEPKGVGRVLDIAARLLGRRISFHLNVVGDGPERPFFERSAKLQGLEDYVSFHGWKSRLGLNSFYRDAHFILLPSSSSEGWPKVLSEAMAYGVVPLASDVSSIPQIVDETGAGHAFPADQPQLYADKIIQYSFDRKAWKTTSQNGVRAAKLFTYETYLDSVRKLFYNSWRIKLID